VVVCCIFIAGCGDDEPAETSQTTEPTQPETQEPENNGGQTEPGTTTPTEIGEINTGSTPMVVKTVPAQGAKLDPGETTIEIHFNKAMNHSVVMPDKVGGFSFPEVSAAPFFKTPKVLVLTVTLEEKRSYALGINQGNKRFKSEDNQPAASFALKFHTKKDTSNIFGWNELEDQELQADQAYLNALVREGEKIKASFKFTLSKTVVSLLNNTVAARNTTEFKGGQKYTDEILEIRHAKFHKIKRSYGEVNITIQLKNDPTGRPPMVVKDAVSGKTYLLVRSGSSYEVTCKGMPVSGEEEKEVKHGLTIPDFLPSDRILKVGDTWKPEGKWLTGLVTLICGLSSVSPESSSLKMKLTSIEKHDNIDIAHIEFTGKINGACPEINGKGTIEIDGIISFDLTNRCFVVIVISGKGGFIGKSMGMGSYNMEMEFSVESDWKYE
jgi:hypothetical protein